MQSLQQKDNTDIYSNRDDREHQIYKDQMEKNAKDL